MNIPSKSRITYVTLRTADGSDVVTNQPVRFNGEPCYFLSLKGLGFKRIWCSDSSAVYSQVSYSTLISLVGNLYDELP